MAVPMIVSGQRSSLARSRWPAQLLEVSLLGKSHRR
jgi:hypothetical protein